MNPKSNHFLDNRKLLSKPSQDPLSIVMVSPEIYQISFLSHLIGGKPEKPQKNS